MAPTKVPCHAKELLPTPSDRYPSEPGRWPNSATNRRPFTVRHLRRRANISPEVALLVSTYQKPKHLARVLQSIAHQYGPPGQFEVVITDDGSTDATRQIASDFADSVSFPVTLTTHAHTHFQLARCRNEGVAASTSPYLLFLDGDCILPPNHVAVHLRHRRPGSIMCGYCIRLDQATSARVDKAAIASGEYVQWPTRSQMRDIRRRDWKFRFYRQIRHPSKPKLTGGNCGMWREDFQRVNGFDENFEGWGGEDTDLGQRLRRAGLRLESILRWTHSYHLWHAPDHSVPGRIRDGQNHAYLTRELRITKCLKGLTTRRAGEFSVWPVGRPSQLQLATTFLKSCEASLSPGSLGGAGQRPDVEVLFLPGKGNFTGRADCKILVVLEHCPRARRLARKADLVVADQFYQQAAREASFRLDNFCGALDHLAGR